MGCDGFLEVAASCETVLHFPQTFAIVNKTKVQWTAWVKSTKRASSDARARGAKFRQQPTHWERLSSRRPSDIATRCRRLGSRARDARDLPLISKGSAARHSARAREFQPRRFCFGIFLPATRSRIARRNFSRSAGLSASILRFIACATVLA